MSIIAKNVSYTYMQGSPFEAVALIDINIKIDDGKFVGLIGHTGSGKSTLIQLFNGLLKPTQGKILINDLDITKKDVDMKKIRQKIGLVFQYPEHQLFEENVYKDIAFGPSNLGLDNNSIQMRVKEALELVGLNYEEIKDRSPFELSGGQRRRVAIAGVLAMKPEVLILDEPTAGLDPRGRKQILDRIKHLHDEHEITIILVSHSMEDIARIVDEIIVINKGRIEFQDEPHKVFARSDELENIGLGIPQIASLMKKLKANGMEVREDIMTVKDAKKEILELLRGKGNA